MVNGYAAWAARWRVPLGFALGLAYLVFAQPTLPLLVLGAGLGLLGILLRAWAAGHLEKNQALATAGPYAYTRNPLYLGSLVVGVGLSLAGASWVIGIAFAAFFTMVYVPVMRREERHLRAQFGETYARYAENVSLFLPLKRAPGDRSQAFRWGLYRRNREYQAGLGFAGGVIFLALKLALR